MKTIKNAVDAIAFKIYFGMQNVKTRAMSAWNNEDGDAYIDTVVKILIAVVVGALLLFGVYKLMEGTVMPELGKRIQELFNKTPTGG